MVYNSLRAIYSLQIHVCVFKFIPKDTILNGEPRLEILGPPVGRPVFYFISKVCSKY